MDENTHSECFHWLGLLYQTQQIEALLTLEGRRLASDGAMGLRREVQYPPLLSRLDMGVALVLYVVEVHWVLIASLYHPLPQRRAQSLPTVSI